MAASRAEALKNRIKTGAGCVAAAIALTLARTPTSTAAALPTAQVEISSIATTAEISSIPSIPSSSSSHAILVAKTSLQDLTQSTSTDNANTPDSSVQASISISRSAAAQAKYDEGEFALSVRLCTACAIGVLMGGMSMKMREVVITSLTACLSTIYAIVPPGLESAAIATMAPSVIAPFAVGFGSLLFSVGYYAIQKPSALRKKSSGLRRRLAINSGIFASAAGAGSACATGQALPAVAFYLIAMALTRDKTRRKHENTQYTQYRSNSFPNSPQIHRRSLHNGLAPVREMAGYSAASPSQTSPQR